MLVRRARYYISRAKWRTAHASGGIDGVIEDPFPYTQEFIPVSLCTGVSRLTDVLRHQDYFWWQL